MPIIVSEEAQRLIEQAARKLAADPDLERLLGDGHEDVLREAATAVVAPTAADTLEEELSFGLGPAGIMEAPMPRARRTTHSEAKLVADFARVIQRHIHLVPAGAKRTEVLEAAKSFAMQFVSASLDAAPQNPRPRSRLLEFKPRLESLRPELSETKRRAVLGRVAALLEVMSVPARETEGSLGERDRRFAERVRKWEQSRERSRPPTVTVDGVPHITLETP